MEETVLGIKEYAEHVEALWISHNNPHGLSIAALGLAGESGEALEHIKKLFRDGVIDEEKFIKEMGDVLYYWCKLLAYMKISPQTVMEENLRKLYSRKSRNKLQGSGDNR